MNVATLFARIGIKADTEKVETLSNGLKKVTHLLLGAGVSVAAFAAGLREVVNASFNTSVSLKQFAAESGASTDTLQKWQSVAQQTNTSMDAITESVKALAENRQKIKLGQGNISGYQLLGIDPNQDPFKVLDELKQKTEGLAPAMKKTVLSQLGVSSQLIQVLDLTNKQFDEMKANAFVIPEQTIQTLAAAKAGMDQLGSAFKWVGALISEKLSPWITKLTRDIILWIKENKDNLIKGLQLLFNIVVKVVDFIVRFVSATMNVIQNTIGWKGALVALIGVLAIFNASILASPITWLIGGIVLLMLIMDDFIKSQDKSFKGKSVFGEFAKAFPVLGGIIKGVFNGIIGTVMALGAALEFDTEKLKEMAEQGNILAKIFLFLQLIMSEFKQIILDISTGHILDIPKHIDMLTKNLFFTESAAKSKSNVLKYAAEKKEHPKDYSSSIKPIFNVNVSTIIGPDGKSHTNTIVKDQFGKVVYAGIDATQAQINRAEQNVAPGNY